jgi:glucosamine--fructose-6-phosphate aminotransferase (isomerizing)
MAAIKLAKEKGAFVFGVCNVVGSSISRRLMQVLIHMLVLKERCILLNFYNNKITVLTMIALRLAKAKGLSHQISYVFAKWN